MQGVQVRPLGPDTTCATPDHLHRSLQSSPAKVQFGLLNDRMIEVCPFSVARVVHAAVVKEQRRIEAAVIDPNWIRPRALRSRSGDQKTPTAAHMGGHQEEAAAIIAQGRRVNPA